MDIITLFDLKVLGKLFLMVLALLYFIFAIVVYRQITLMTQTLNSNIAPIVKVLALLQIAAVAVLFFLIAILA